MGNYPIWWDTPLTIYNRHEDKITNVVKWYRHTVEKCFWKYTGNKVTIGDTVLETNTTICRIPKSENFKEKYEWEELPNDLKAGYFTLGQGDIIVKGAVDEEIDEYVSKKRSTDFLAKYKKLQGCISIETVAVNTGIGRNNEHYYVTGV